jgi:chromosome partitioning protein
MPEITTQGDVMILTIGNTKGGVGKTTIAINLAVARAMAGSDVWLIDGDSQGTAQTAISLRSAASRSPGIACSSYSDGTIMRSQIKQQMSKFEDIIIDIGARDSTALRAAITLADILLVPFQPRNFDVWALSDIASIINEANSMRDGLRCYAMLNMADPTNTSDNKEAAETVEDFPQLTFLNAPLRRRKSFANAAGMGLCVYELSPREKDVKACDELRELYGAIF